MILCQRCWVFISSVVFFFYLQIFVTAAQLCLMFESFMTGVKMCRCESVKWGRKMGRKEKKKPRTFLWYIFIENMFTFSKNIFFLFALMLFFVLFVFIYNRPFLTSICVKGSCWDRGINRSGKTWSEMRPNGKEKSQFLLRESTDWCPHPASSFPPPKKAPVLKTALLLCFKSICTCSLNLTLHGLKLLHLLRLQRNEQVLQSHPEKHKWSTTKCTVKNM